MKPKREIVGGVNGGLGYEEPSSVFSALALLGTVAMIAGADDAQTPVHGPASSSSSAPLAASATSSAFPSLTKPVCQTLMCAARVAPLSVRRDRFTHGWTDGIKCRAERIAEVFGPWLAERFAVQVAIAVLHLSRDPDELGLPLEELAAHLGVRQDAAQAAVDLLTRRDSIAAPSVSLPAGGGTLPGKPGRAFTLASGEETDSPLRAPFPARAILTQAQKGSPQAVAYIRKLAALAGTDPGAAHATGALKRTDALQRLEGWSGHYQGVRSYLKRM